MTTVRRPITFAVTAALLVMIAIPALAGETTETHLDMFSAQGFGGNDGTLDYAGPWIEIGESDGPTSGYVRVWDHLYCDNALCLKVGGTDGNAGGHGAYRVVDLSGATRAKLTFESGTELLGENSRGTAVVQVSPNGGDTWSTIKTFSLDSDDGDIKFRTTIVITDWATPDTVIRFMITEAPDLGAYWLIDNVAVEAWFEEAPATTTEPPETTTTEPPETTTTEPPEPTTTTTTEPPETTTTKPPEPTTTTTTTRPLEPTTTTSVPRTTTSTAPPLTFDEDVSPEDQDTMMNKSGLAVTAAMPPIAVSTSSLDESSQATPHAKPVEALAAAFFTHAGSYGGNLLPSIALGIVIAVVCILGIGSRKEE